MTKSAKRRGWSSLSKASCRGAGGTEEGGGEKGSFYFSEFRALEKTLGEGTKGSTPRKEQTIIFTRGTPAHIIRDPGWEICSHWKGIPGSGVIIKAEESESY